MQTDGNLQAQSGGGRVERLEPAAQSAADGAERDVIDGRALGCRMADSTQRFERGVHERDGPAWAGGRASGEGVACRASSRRSVVGMLAARRTADRREDRSRAPGPRPGASSVVASNSSSRAIRMAVMPSASA